jgi:pimeloyl-ACP methyl ester carboxylesterase
LGKTPVLFIPGTLCTGAVFDSQTEALSQTAPHLDVVQFTHEDSISRMADKAIESINRRSGAAIIGFSMGGMVAMEIARIAPELIKKLALLNTNFHADLPDRKSARVRHLRQAKSEGIESVIRQHYLDRYLHQPTISAINLIIKMADEMGVDCFEAQISALASRPDSGETLSEIKCSTLILGARQDQLCPPSGQLRMQEMIENSKLQILESCGHFSMLERPLEVNQALRHWYLCDQ